MIVIFISAYMIASARLAEKQDWIEKQVFIHDYLLSSPEGFDNGNNLNNASDFLLTNFYIEN